MKDYPSEFDNEDPDNRYFAQAFPDADGPAELYRQVYKYTSCGAYLSVQIQYYKTIEPDGFNEFPFDKLVSEWVDCGELSRLGTWKDMDQQGVVVTSLLVGSSVEGVDEGTDNIEVDAKQAEEDPLDYRTRFDASLIEVEQQAESIWNNTHGCESCVAYWTDQGIDIDDSGGLVPVYKYCPDCQGSGVSI
jgi:hypothetical protein